MTLLLVELGPQTTQVLGIVGLLVTLTGLALAGSLIVIESLTVLLLPALNVPEEWMLAEVELSVSLAGRYELVLRLLVGNFG